MTRERRLGRGLEALLSRAPAPAVPQMPAEVAETPGELSSARAPEASAAPAPPLASAEQHAPERSDPMRIDVDLIDGNPAQPRENFDPEETRTLAESIRAHGLLQPVVVRQVDEGRYQLVAGERRLRAAKQAGWNDVPANIIEADDRQMAELAIVENLQRKDLNALEKAASFQRYLDHYGCTQEELAERLKLDRSTIANLIRLLELPEPVQEAVRRGHITQGHARALLPLGEEPDQVAFCERIQQESLNVRQTESLVQETIHAAEHRAFGVVGAEGNGGRSARVKSEHILALEQELRSALGMKVKISVNVRGRGKLTISFRNHEEFDRLREQLTDGGRPELQIHTG